MKPAFRNTLIWLLTLCILLSSVGVALSEQFCNMSGKEQATQEQEDTCCKHADKDDDCCTAKVSLLKLELEAGQKVTNIQLPVFYKATYKVQLPQLSFYPTTDQRIFTYTNTSPPRSGRQLLCSHHVLVV